MSNRFPEVHKRGIHRHTDKHIGGPTHTQTHTTIAKGEMQSVAFRLKMIAIDRNEAADCVYR